MNFLQFLMKKKELISLFTFVSFAGFGTTYICIFKPDVVVDIKKADHGKNVAPNQFQKLVTINQKWEAIEELQTVKKLTK